MTPPRPQREGPTINQGPRARAAARKAVDEIFC